MSKPAQSRKRPGPPPSRSRQGGGPPPRARTDRETGLPRDVVDELRQSAKPGRADDALARLRRASELLERGDAKGASLEAKKARDDAPRSAFPREIYGLALYGLARYPEALAEMQAYRRMSGRADQNHIIADCLRATGRPEKAVPLAEEALRSKAPDEAKAEAVIVAASALADLKRYDEALAMLSRARTREDVGRDYVLRLWYVRGDVLDRAGRRREAAEEFRKITRHDAGAFDAAERLAALG